MNIQELFKLQNILDNRISEQHELNGFDLFPKKALALLVEVGELANETRCFKFWSLKSASEKKVILEEYVDCLHFILSLGLEKNFNDITEIKYKELDLDLTQLFLEFYTNVTNFINSPSREKYVTVFESFLTLGHNLEFSESEIENAYLSKNEVNHKRQDEGY